jgi:hypothetical protein
VGSADIMVRFRLPDNRWARCRVWTTLRYWPTERPSSARCQELFLVHNPTGSRGRLFHRRLHFVVGLSLRYYGVMRGVGETKIMLLAADCVPPRKRGFSVLCLSAVKCFIISVNPREMKFGKLS